MKLIVASNNAHKVAELDAILSALGFEVCSLKEAGLHVEPEETGEVRALNGAPGVHSARYGGLDSDRARLELLLHNMEHEDDRAACFVSVITLLLPNGRKIVARGECPGELLREAHGEGGFGYDPIFYIPEAGCTFAEMPAEQKNRISHRARALKLLAEKIGKEQWDANE